MNAPQLNRTFGRSPMVTLAVPTYNRSSLLEKCVKSALMQTYNNFEVLVVDNSSEDNTIEMLEKIADQRLRVIRQIHNVGSLRNFNSCLEHAHGEYIVFLSDDDLVSPWLIDSCISLLPADFDTSIVVALSDYHDSSTGVSKMARASATMPSGIYNGTDILLAYLKGHIRTLAGCSILIKTSIFRKLGGFRLDLLHTADVAAWASLLVLGRVGFVNIACATCYGHNDSETAKLGLERLIDDGWEVTRIISKLAEIHVVDPSLRRDIQISCERCFAGRGFTVLSCHRRNGGRLRDVLRHVWYYRRNFQAASKRSVLRFVAVLVLPRALRVRVQRRLRVPGLRVRGLAHTLATAKQLNIPKY